MLKSSFDNNTYSIYFCRCLSTRSSNFSQACFFCFVEQFGWGRGKGLEKNRWDLSSILTFIPLRSEALKPSTSLLIIQNTIFRPYFDLTFRIHAWIVTFFCFSFVFKHNIVEEKTKFGLLYREREVILHLKIMNLHIHNDRQTKEEPKARCFSHPNAIVFKLDWNYSSELLSTHWNRKCMSFVMLKYFRNYEINLFG